MALVLAPLVLAAAATPSPAPPSDSGSPEDSSRATVRVDSGTDPGAGTDTRAATRAGYAATLVAGMTPREKAAAVVMGHVPTTDAAALADYMRETGVGGFILMRANIGSVPSEVRAVAAALTVDAALPPLLAIDQEGGDVSRLRWDDAPSALTLEGADAAVVADAFAERGAIVAESGLDVNFGVVADWTDDPASFIARRVLGTSAESAAGGVAAAVAGEAPFAASTLKHFPGHGAAPGDSHRTLPRTEMSREQWRAEEALPFVAGIDAGAPLVMFGHLVYSSVDGAPASLSPAWHDILRNDLGFTGVAVTDDMAMLEASGAPEYADPVENAVLALLAGNDLILGVGYSSAERANAVVDGIAAAVESGRIPLDRIDEAVTRVLALRLGLPPAAVACDDCTPVG